MSAEISRKVFRLPPEFFGVLSSLAQRTHARCRVYAHTSKGAFPVASTNLVLRTVYLSPAVDDKLSDEAYFTRTSKNDLIRRYIEAGMKALSGQVASPPAAARNAPAAKKAAPAKKAATKKALVAKKAVPARKAVGAKKALAKKAAAARATM